MTTAPKDATPDAPEPRDVVGGLSDPEELLGVPAHDPVALGDGAPLPFNEPANILPIEMEPPVRLVADEEVPALDTMTGAQQNRVEVLTGKRLQKPPEAPPPARAAAKPPVVVAPPKAKT